ncbi:MAG: PAS domain S-box protein [Spirochaetes bacterium]|nr:PAS domain S-box protein [Spirochaetota bacterium]
MKRKRVLMVERDTAASRRLCGMLERGGYDVVTAAGADGALEEMRGDGEVDLLLLDAEQGPGGGCTAAMAGLLGERRIPVVFLLGGPAAETAAGVPHCVCVAREAEEPVLLATLETAIAFHGAAGGLPGHGHARELEDLRVRENRLARIVDNAKDMVFRMTIPEGRYEYMNRASESITGYSPEEFYHDPLLVKKQIHPDSIGYFDEQWQKILAGDPPQTYEFKILHRSGEERWVSQRNVFERDGRGRITAIEGIVTDVTERVRAEVRRQAVVEALRESEEKFRGIAEQLSDVIFITDAAGVIVYISPATMGLFGMRQHEIVGRVFTEFLREDQIPVAGAAFARVIESGEPQRTIVLVMKRSDGSEFFGELTAKMFTYGGGRPGTLGLIRDISERRRAEEDLARSMEDKNTLLRELQHRVKNSIGMISAVVDMESMRIDDESIRGVLKSIRDRLTALSSLYDLLFRSHGADRVQLHDYLDHICGYLVHTYLAGSERITVHKQFDPVAVTMKTAVPLGIIVNELFTNSLKYAFPENRRGAVSVIVRRVETELVLQVTDDGIGLPEGAGPVNDRGLGSVLVELLTRQLHGSLHVQPGVGTIITVTVPLSPQDMASP